MIRYRISGKVKEEGLGWASEGWTERKAAAVLAELKANQTTGAGPQTLQEKRAILDRENLEKKRQALRDEQLVMDNVFLRYCESNSGKKSLKDEKNYYKNWIYPFIGKKRLNEIVLLDLQRIQKKMEAAGRAPRSIHYIKSIVRQVFHYAIDQNLFTGELPTARFLKQKQQKRFDNKRQRYLSPEQADELLSEIRKHSEKTYRVALLSLNSAMRFGEIAGLRWQHINTSNREIIVLDPKNNESRSVYMTDTVIKMFEEMKRGKPDDLVFPARQPKYYDSTQQPMKAVSKVFDRAVATLGLNEGITDRRMKIVFHRLRHSCASWLVNAGIELPTIARILGHKSITMTMRYSHVDDETVAGAMAVLDRRQNGDNKTAVGGR
jgi:integrase